MAIKPINEMKVKLDVQCSIFDITFINRLQVRGTDPISADISLHKIKKS